VRFNQEVVFVYYIGIDIAKYKHDCFIATETGEVVRNTFTFLNDRSGFQQLHTVLQGLDPTQIKRIGFEATSHYTMNLKLFLEQLGCDFMELNPVLTAKFRSATTLRRSKTDKMDAQLIALYLMSVDYKPYPVPYYHICALKSLTRLRDTQVRQRSHHLVQLTNLMDLIFPEFKPFFNHSFTVTALYLVENYATPEKIANMNAKSYEILRRLSHGRFSYAKFLQLKTLAHQTVGNATPILELEFASVLRLYRAVSSEIDLLEHEIKGIMARYAFPTASIHGIGILSAASIVAEYGDFSRFDNPAKMLAYAGLEPSINQSGTTRAPGHMVKRGSSHLRFVLLNVSMYLLIHNPTYYTFYRKKRDEGKSHRVALSHVAKKLVRLIFKLENEHLQFDMSLVR
jgi:transposase